RAATIAAWPARHRSSGRSSRAGAPASGWRDRAPIGADRAVRRCSAASAGAARSPASARASDVTPALAADAHLLAVVVESVPDPGRTAGGTHQGDVRDVDRHVLVDDAALHRGPGGLLVTARDVHAV